NGDAPRFDVAALRDLAGEKVFARGLEYEEDGQGGQFAPNGRRVRAMFRFNGVPYTLALTDAVKENEYLLGQDGAFSVQDAILCISLGEPYKGDAYKLAAALITKDRLEVGNG